MGPVREGEKEVRSKTEGRVAQRIRARGYEPRSRGFKSLHARPLLVVPRFLP